MLQKLKLLVLTGLCAGVVAACDRALTEPALADIDSLLAAAGPVAGDFGYASTLPTLFREAVANVEKTRGRRAVESLLSKWRELQEALKAEAPGAPRSAVEARLAAIHTEELRVVRRVLGDAVITRIMGETSTGLATARGQIALAEIAGADVSAAQSTMRQIRDLMAAASGALLVSDLEEALDFGTQAAGMLATLRHQLIELRRVPGLETLFPRAVARLRTERGDAAATSLLAKLDALEAQAHAAVRAGDRQRAHQALDQVRAEQIRIVHRVLGDATTALLVEQVGIRAAEARARLVTLSDMGRDVVRHERMLKQAADLNKRAAAALAAGDAATALDLGSHAAGLLNALQHLTWH